MLKRIANWILPCFALGMGTLGMYHVASSSTNEPDTTPPRSPLTIAESGVIAARGLIEPRGESVALGAAVTGKVIEVYKTSDHVGEVVDAGTPLFRVDDRALQAQLVVARAQLEQARAQLMKLQAMPRPEEIPASDARVKQAQAQLITAQDRHQRVKELLPNQASTEEELIKSANDLRIAEELVREAESSHALLLAGAWQPDLQIAQAAVQVAEAEVNHVETEIERTLVRAPSRGTLLQVDVRSGEFISIQASKPLMTLGDLSTLRVRAEIDEEDAPAFLPNATARAYVRGDAAHEIPLRLVRVEPYVTVKKSWTGDNTERQDTRVLTVIYEATANQPGLYVGQMVDVTIDRAASSAPAVPQG